MKFKEYMEKNTFGKCRGCEGCLEMVTHFIESHVPIEVTDYKQFEVPKGLLAQYYEREFRGIVGERSR